MFDFKFDWNEQISIGIEEIDLQHKELFRIVRSMERLILIGCGGMTRCEILQCLCELRDYVTYHFYTEEALIAKINPDRLERHHRIHEAFKEKINAIDCDQLVDNPQQGFKEIKDMVQEWVFHHMMQIDKVDLNK